MIVDTMTKRAFGDLEQDILQLFQSGSRLTVRQVQALLGDEDKYTTIMTVMYRLFQKKRLARERVGAHFEYWILHPEASRSSFLAQLKKKLFGMKTSSLISHLIESSTDITDHELVEIEKLIREARKKR